MDKKEDTFKESEEFLEWAKKQQKKPDFYWKKSLDAIDDPVFIISANGVVLICNESLEKYLNMPAKDITGKKCHTLVHGTDTFTGGCPFVKSHVSGKREEYILKMSERYYRMTVDPIFDREEKFAGAVHIISDINDMLKTNAELAMLGKVIENSADGVISTDLEYRIKGWNGGAERMLGYLKDEVLDKNFGDLLYNSPEKVMDEIVGNFHRKRQTERKDAKFRTKNGDVIDVSLGASPVYDEREVLSGAAFILTDHTKQRKAEQNLLSFMAETVLRFEKPLEMIKTNIEDILNLYEKRDIDREELSELLSIQVYNAEKVLENIAALKTATAEKGDAIPDIMKDFLRQ